MKRLFLILLLLVVFEPVSAQASFRNSRECGRVIKRLAVITLGLSLGMSLKEPTVLQANNYSETDSRSVQIDFIGDSAVRDFHLDRVDKMFFTTWTSNLANPFMNNSSRPEAPFSFFEHIAVTGTPVKAVSHQRSGAAVYREREGHNDFVSWLFNIKHMETQVDEVLSATRKPDFIMLAIGGNNLDWPKGLSEKELQDPEQVLNDMADRFEVAYREQLLRLVKMAEQKPTKTSIVVYGILDTQSIYDARLVAQERRKQDPTAYPYFENVAEVFQAMTPKYINAMTDLNHRYNARMQKIVSEIRAQIEGPSPQVFIYYSDSLSTADFGNPRNLNHIDGWHLSPFGQTTEVRGLLNGAEPGLNFLGIQLPWSIDLPTKTQK